MKKSDMEFVVEWMNSSPTGRTYHHHPDGRFSQETKVWSEEQAVTDWCTAKSLQGSQKYCFSRSNEDDPPDCYAIANGREIGVEVASLVREDLEKLMVQARRRSPSASIYHAPYFLHAVWNEEQLVNEIQRLLKKKSQAVIDAGKRIEVLLLVVDQGFIEHEQVARWLSDSNFDKHQGITSCELMLGYTPGHPLRYPVFTVY